MNSPEEKYEAMARGLFGSEESKGSQYQLHFELQVVHEQLRNEASQPIEIQVTIQKK